MKQDVPIEQYEAGEAAEEKRRDALTSKDETPLGYLHEITEPQWGDGPTRMYSASADNPWSHWTEKYRDTCAYKCTPLYARSAPETPAEPVREPVACPRCSAFVKAHGGPSQVFHGDGPCPPYFTEKTSAPTKQDCTCTETCQRHGRPFPPEWSWRCQGLPFLPREIDQLPEQGG